MCRTPSGFQTFLTEEGVEVPMKRAVFIVLAALFVLLSYLSADSLAVTSSQSDVPGIVTPVSGPYDDMGFAGDGDDGDADDLSGIRGRNPEIDVSGTGSATANSFESFRSFLQVWWNLMVFTR
jgi:hypothetical protein